MVHDETLVAVSPFIWPICFIRSGRSAFGIHTVRWRWVARLLVQRCQDTSFLPPQVISALGSEVTHPRKRKT